jgi:hypothetical protein
MQNTRRFVAESTGFAPLRDEPIFHGYRRKDELGVSVGSDRHNRLSVGTEDVPDMQRAKSMMELKGMLQDRGYIRTENNVNGVRTAVSSNLHGGGNARVSYREGPYSGGVAQDFITDNGLDTTGNTSLFAGYHGNDFDMTGENVQNRNGTNKRVNVGYNRRGDGFGFDVMNSRWTPSDGLANRGVPPAQELSGGMKYKFPISMGGDVVASVRGRRGEHGANYSLGYKGKNSNANISINGNKDLMASYNWRF